LVFRWSRRRGSYIILAKEAPGGRVGTVVPDHRELKVGTLKGVLELAGVEETEFTKYQ
jgi:predicted RNA binding protein YcfA (HicA-like mRNA interferase family)